MSTPNHLRVLRSTFEEARYADTSHYLSVETYEPGSDIVCLGTESVEDWLRRAAQRNEKIDRALSFTVVRGLVEVEGEQIEVLSGIRNKTMTYIGGTVYPASDANLEKFLKKYAEEPARFEDRFNQMIETYKRVRGPLRIEYMIDTRIGVAAPFYPDRDMVIDTCWHPEG